jgi:glycerol-3-phosphate dehydrogenase
VRLGKGSHIITRKFWNGGQAYLLQHNDKRVVFVNPYEGDLALIGTTDIPLEGRAEDARIDQSEIEYLSLSRQPLLRERAQVRRGHLLFFWRTPPP